MYSCWFKVSFGQTFCFMAGIQKSTMVRIITCTCSKSTSCIIFNIVYNLLNNIVYYMYIHFLYLINKTLVSYYMWGVEVE